MSNYAEIRCGNGEIFRVERWVYEMWVAGTLKDPFLLVHMNRAVSITILW